MFKVFKKPTPVAIRQHNANEAEGCVISLDQEDRDSLIFNTSSQLSTMIRTKACFWLCD